MNGINCCGTGALASASRFVEVFCELSCAQGALICARVSGATDASCGLGWEVYGDDPREPLRYGLCLAREEEGYAVQVPVTGLQPGRRYRFQFVLDGRASPLGEFRTQVLAAPMAA